MKNGTWNFVRCCGNNEHASLGSQVFAHALKGKDKPVKKASKAKPISVIKHKVRNGFGIDLISDLMPNLPPSLIQANRHSFIYTMCVTHVGIDPISHLVPNLDHAVTLQDLEGEIAQHVLHVYLHVLRLPQTEVRIRIPVVPRQAVAAASFGGGGPVDRSRGAPCREHATGAHVRGSSKTVIQTFHRNNRHIFMHKGICIRSVEMIHRRQG